MKHEVRAESDIADAEMRMAVAEDSAPAEQDAAPERIPRVLTIQELLELNLPQPKTLIESDWLPVPGASLMVGAPKSGKTLLAVQCALAVASGKPLFDNYRVLEVGPALILEQDDPAGASTVKTILQRSKITLNGVPLHFVPRVPFTFGFEFLHWLGGQIAKLNLRVVVLDSYTALRASRGSGVDIVKAEQSDLTLLDKLAKDTNCTILVITHDSKGRAGMDWDLRAAGTFAMTAATEGQIHISRFTELETNAPERLVRIRGRHIDGAELVLRFRKETLDYEHVLEGGAAPLYPLVAALRRAFDTRTFSPKDVSQSTGVSRATAHRQLDRLHVTGAVTKRGHGEYILAV